MQYNIDKKENKKDKSNKFPVKSLIVLLLCCILFVYSTISIVMFCSSFAKQKATLEKQSTVESSVVTTQLDASSDTGVASTTAETEQVVTEDESTTIGNIEFNIKAVFGIEDYSSTITTVILFAFCLVDLVALVLILLSALKIARYDSSKRGRAFIAILLVIVGLALGAITTYYTYQLQLDIFKEEKDASFRSSIDVTKDTNGYYYSLDSNGVPFLSLVVDDEDATTEDYTGLASAIGQSDIDTLYIQCEYSNSEGKTSLTKENTITISKFYVENVEGGKVEITLSKPNLSDEKIVHYDVTCDEHTLTYKMVIEGEQARTDMDSKTTFLVVGKDRVALNTDVMILIELYEDNGKYKANILQIPRDTYNRISSNSKINAVYSRYYNACSATDQTERITAGMEGLVDTLESNWCLKIDYWAIMDLNGFSSIVDGIGGVDMYVPFDMKYEDYSAEPPLVIDLKEGQQTLHGSEAEQFIRYRKGYVTGDLGRVDATKLFLTAFFCKLRSELSVTNPGALSNTIGTLMTYVTSDLDAGNAVAYLKKVLKLELTDITFLNVPGNSVTTTASYYVASKNGLYYVINTYFNVYDTDIDKSQFDSSRMFTDSGRGTAVDNIYSAAFNQEDYEANLKDAEQINNDNNGDNEMINKILK